MVSVNEMFGKVGCPKKIIIYDGTFNLKCMKEHILAFKTNLSYLEELVYDFQE